MTFWGSIWPSHNNGTILNRPTNLDHPSAPVPLPSKGMGDVRSAATFASDPVEVKGNLCPYSMVQSHPYGLDERVGWATHLEYI